MLCNNPVIYYIAIAIMQFLVWIAWNLTYLAFANGLVYDAKTSINRRVWHLKTVCDKYRNKNTYAEYQALFAEVKDPSANYVQNVASRFFVCVPPENGALYWNRFFRHIHNFDLKVNM